MMILMLTKSKNIKKYNIKTKAIPAFDFASYLLIKKIY